MTMSPPSQLPTVYARVSERLAATGLSNREACRKAGLHLDTIRNMRRALATQAPGRRSVTTHTLAALAPVLGVTPDWLLGFRAKPELDDEGDLVPWSEVGRQLDWDTGAGSRAASQARFATRTPDASMNLLAPVGSHLIVDRGDRALVEGRSYVGLLDGRAIFRRWASDPDRAEPYSSDPTFKAEYLSGGRRWEIVGRVVRAVVDL